MSQIEIKNLTKKFGSFVAVDDLSFEIEKGDFFAILGPNGAGKSTLLKMMMTLSRNYSGEIKILGYDARKNTKQIRENIGIVLENVILYDKLTAMENLIFFSGLYHLSKRSMLERAEKLLKAVDMWQWKDKKIGKFSTGMKQRINIVRALMHDPEILFLDEPTASLDLQSSITIRSLLKDVNAGGKSVVFTSHTMSEVEETANRIAILNMGKLVAAGTLENIASKVKDNRRNLKIEIEDGKIDDYKKCFQQSGIKNYEANAHMIILFYSDDEELGKILDTISKFHLQLRSINTVTESLERIFLKLTEDHKR